jgi:hypothetical protein
VFNIVVLLVWVSITDLVSGDESNVNPPREPRCLLGDNQPAGRD